jgi:lysophospholipase L1-like esterase
VPEESGHFSHFSEVCFGRGNSTPVFGEVKFFPEYCVWGVGYTETRKGRALGVLFMPARNRGNETSPQEPVAAPLAEENLATGLKQFFVKFCVSVTLFFLFLAFGELASYIYLSLNPVPPLGASLSLDADYARELDDSGTHQYLPFVEWRRRPYRGRFISIDKDGVRQTLNSRCDDERNLQIWMFGDSALWGTGVTDADTIPSQLAELYTDSGQRVCIKNFGEAGWVSTQELIELLLQLKQNGRRPDVVVFYDGTDEVFMPDPGAPKDIHHGYHRFRELLENARAESTPGLEFLNQSNTVRALELFAQQLNRSRSKIKRELPSKMVQTVAETSVTNYQKNLQIVDSLAPAYGFRPFYFWYPTSSFGMKTLTAEEQDSVRQEMQETPSRYELKQAIYALCSRIDRANFYYLGDALDDEHRRVYLDGAHLTAEGNRIMAQKIFQILENKPNRGLRKLARVLKRNSKL